jgi:hypothetical protein
VHQHDIVPTYSRKIAEAMEKAGRTSENLSQAVSRLVKQLEHLPVCERHEINRDPLFREIGHPLFDAVALARCRPGWIRDKRCN